MLVSSASLYPHLHCLLGAPKRCRVCNPHVPCLHPLVLSAFHGPCEHPYVQCLRLHACRLHPMSPGLFPHVPRLQSHVAPTLSTLYLYLRGSVTFLLVFLFSVPLSLVPVALLSPRSRNAHRHLVAARRSAQAPPCPFLTGGGPLRTRRLGACASRGPEGVARKPSA